MAGDLFSSLMKRRLNCAPSSRATGLDQIPESPFTLLACRGALALSVLDISICVPIFFTGEVVRSLSSLCCCTKPIFATGPTKQFPADLAHNPSIVARPCARYPRLRATSETWMAAMESDTKWPCSRLAGQDRFSAQAGVEASGDQPRSR